MRTLIQYKDFFNLLNEDMALSMFRKNLITFNKENILDKKVDPDELLATKLQFNDIIAAIKDVQSDEHYKKILGTGDNYIKDKKYCPVTLYSKIVKLKQQEKIIKAVLDNNKRKNTNNAFETYEIPGTDIVVFIPFTPEANRFLAHSVLTKPGQPVPTWCIAASDAKTLWLNYYKLNHQKYPPVFIFCRKTSIGDRYDNNKYEVVFTRQSTEDIVNGDRPLFVDQSKIEWRHPQQTEHGDYWGYSNRFRKVFPEIAGHKALDIMAELMEKYYSDWNLLKDESTEKEYGEDIIGWGLFEAKENAAKKEFFDYLNTTGWENRVGSKDWYHLPVYALWYLERGNNPAGVWPFISYMYNNGDYHDELKSLIYLLIILAVKGVKPINNTQALFEIPSEFFTDKEICEALIEWLRHFGTPDQDFTLFYDLTPILLSAIKLNILSEKEAIKLYIKNKLLTPQFIRVLATEYCGDSDHQMEEADQEKKDFLVKVQKNLLQLEPYIKEVYPNLPMDAILNSLIIYYDEIKTIPNSKSFVDDSLKLCYKLITGHGPKPYIFLGGAIKVIRESPAELRDKIENIILTIFKNYPNSITVNAKFIKENIKVFSDNFLKHFPYLTHGNYSQANAEAYQVISKFKNKTITQEDLRDSIHSAAALQILKYINSNQIDLSKFKIDPEIFFGWILANSSNDDASLGAISQFIDDNYQDIKYTPFYNQINNKKLQIFVIQYILDTFIKTGNLDTEWFNYLCELNGTNHPMDGEISQILLKFLHGSTEQKAKKLIKKYMPDKYDWCFPTID